MIIRYVLLLSHVLLLYLQRFQLATSSHLIYSGQLLLVDSSDQATNSIELHAVLMSDLILLTRPDPDNNELHVIQQPIMLINIVGCNFSCLDGQ